MHARTHRIGIWIGVSALLALATSHAHAQQPGPAAQPPPPAPQPAPPQRAGQPYYGQPQPQPYYGQPAQQPYYGQPQPVQPGYVQPAYGQPRQRQTVSRPNIGLIVSGAVLLGVGWITNIVFGLPAGDDPFVSGGAPPAWETFRVTSIIPIAGPWIQLAVKPTDFGQDYWGPWLIIDGLMQTAGIIMLSVGIATPQTQTAAAARSDGLRLAFVPRVGPGHVGGALVGAF